MGERAADLEVWTELKTHFKTRNLEDWILEVEKFVQSEYDQRALALSAKTLFDAHFGMKSEEHQNLVLGYGLISTVLFFRTGQVAQAFSLMTRLGRCENSEAVVRYLGDLFGSMGYIDEKQLPETKEHHASVLEVDEIIQNLQHQHLLERSTDLGSLTAHLGLGQMFLLLEKAKVRKTYSGERLFHRNEKPKYLYILVEGEARLILGGEKNLRLKSGSVFGEVSLFLGKKHHTCEALVVEDGEVLEFAIEDLVDLFIENPQLEANFRSLLYWRLFENFALTNQDLKEASRKVLEEFFFSCSLRVAHHGESIKLNTEDGLAVLLDGSATVSKGVAAREVTGPGFVWLDSADVKVKDHLLYMAMDENFLQADRDDFRFIRRHLEKHRQRK